MDSQSDQLRTQILGFSECFSETIEAKESRPQVLSSYVCRGRRRGPVIRLSAVNRSCRKRGFMLFLILIRCKLYRHDNSATFHRVKSGIRKSRRAPRSLQVPSKRWRLVVIDIQVRTRSFLFSFCIFSTFIWGENRYVYVRISVRQHGKCICAQLILLLSR